jgi:hypothetical protein
MNEALFTVLSHSPCSGKGRPRRAILHNRGVRAATIAGDEELVLLMPTESGVSLEEVALPGHADSSPDQHERNSLVASDEAYSRHMKQLDALGLDMDDMDIGEVPQLTVRAVVAGLGVGTVLCFTNMYFGLQTGWVGRPVFLF